MDLYWRNKSAPLDPPHKYSQMALWVPNKKALQTSFFYNSTFFGQDIFFPSQKAPSKFNFETWWNITEKPLGLIVGHLLHSLRSLFLAQEPGGPPDRRPGVRRNKWNTYQQRPLGVFVGRFKSLWVGKHQKTPFDL